MDEPAEAHVADHRPAELDHLFLGVEGEELVEEGLVDVLVVDVEALGEVERGLLLLAEVLVAPRCDLRDGRFFERVAFP